jgi:AcrR family transcriptional regulator
MANRNIYTLFDVLLSLGMTVSGEQSHTRTTPRERRRAQTRQEILDAALEVMSEEGVAGLNLTRVASRVGLRQPSLYQYFPSRDAVYDALFEQGTQGHLQVISEAMDAAPAPGWAAACAAAYANLRFIVDHPVVAQLLFNRVVPGFRPSDQAFAPSVEVRRRVVVAMNTAVERGELHPAAASERGLHLAIALLDGVANERVANQPDLTSEQDLHDLLGPALDMFATYFAAGRPRDWTPWPRRGAPNGPPGAGD